MRNSAIPALAECPPSGVVYRPDRRARSEKSAKSARFSNNEKMGKEACGTGRRACSADTKYVERDRRVTLLGFKPPNIAKSLPSTFDIPCSTFCGSKRANVPIERRLTLLATYRPSTFDLPAFDLRSSRLPPTPPGNQFHAPLVYNPSPFTPICPGKCYPEAMRCSLTPVVLSFCAALSASCLPAGFSGTR